MGYFGVSRFLPGLILLIWEREKNIHCNGTSPALIFLQEVKENAQLIPDAEIGNEELRSELCRERKCVGVGVYVCQILLDRSGK